MSIRHRVAWTLAIVGWLLMHLAHRIDSQHVAYGKETAPVGQTFPTAISFKITKDDPNGA